MAVTFISIDSFPTYLALSTDIDTGKIPEATAVGKTVLLTDTGAWKIITAGDGTVADFTFPTAYTPV